MWTLPKTPRQEGDGRQAGRFPPKNQTPGMFVAFGNNSSIDSMQHESPLSSLGSLYTGVKLLLGLQIENLRLKLTEKITILLAMVAFYAVVMALGLVFFVFVSLALSDLLATVLPPYIAYMILALVYVLAFVLICLLRRQIFIDPIARFMSRLLVEFPEDERKIINHELITKEDGTEMVRNNQ